MRPGNESKRAKIQSRPDEKRITGATIRRWAAPGNRYPISGFDLRKLFLEGRRVHAFAVLTLRLHPLWRLLTRWLTLAVLTGTLPSRAQSTQTPDGIITFRADSARTLPPAAILKEGTDKAPTLNLSASPGPGATWDFKPTRWGHYSVEIDVAGAPPTGVELELQVGGQTVRSIFKPGTAPSENQAIPLGKFYLEKEGPTQVEVRLVGPDNVPVVALNAVRFVPSAEGLIPPSSTDGIITLPSGAATTHSVTMRYEPAAVKNCLGYWVNPSDWADWEFQVNRPGIYEVELWQGCGRGQGGSAVSIQVADKTFSFTVEETGHFQNFVPRRLGRVQFPSAGAFTLAIHPQSKKAAAVMDVRQIRLIPATTAVEAAPSGLALVGARRVVILGDSITYDGKWVDFLETWLRATYPDSPAEVINLGLPSETASGLSEAGHAGGSFPRPDVHERLDRVLEKTHPDLILACYGMNDGIYFPQSEERFKKFQDGIQRLHEKAAHVGVRVIHLTPAVFDPLPLAGRTLPAGRDAYPQPYEGYNEVLDQYAAWLVGQRSQGWQVIDIHSAVNQFLAQQRQTDPKFTVSPDGVHPNEQGHWLMAREVIRELGGSAELTSPSNPSALPPSILTLVRQRQSILKDAWLTTVGHQRPGMNPGKPLPEAEQAANEITARLTKLVRP